MMPDGISAVQSRISEIEAAFGINRVTSTTVASTTSTTGDFSSSLAVALGSSDAVAATGLGSTTATTPTSTTRTLTLDDVLATNQTSGVNSAGVPLELAAYGNGQIPEVALTSIGQGSHRLWDPAARAFRAMAQDAAASGVVLSVTDSYRSYDQQVDLAERKGLYSQGGLAAVPGTSEHGWGKALDINTGNGAVEWLRANAGRYGFEETTPREPWHWVYQAS